MVAYNFQKRFAPHIVSGRKRHTIRADRRRHARPGEAIQLFIGMRTKGCAKIIADPICEAVKPIAILLHDNRINAIWIDDQQLEQSECERLAFHDGFGNLEEMHSCFLEMHGSGLFEGVIICWQGAD